ncbi:hypothetical protein [Haloarchaeobius sp. TZWSO28]|uniref:hypothetical protein n=1 Tax=Haloarchaeobius sp. TZWSO28 TaxID=3446119 RepID=UPI003EB86CE0
MPTESLSLEDLMGHETDPIDVRDLTADPENFKFTFHRDDIGIVEHEGYPVEVTPVATSDDRQVRASEDDGWRFFAEIRTADARMGSNVTTLLEDNDGNIQDVLIDSDGIEALREVTISPIE